MISRIGESENRKTEIFFSLRVTTSKQAKLVTLHETKKNWKRKVESISHLHTTFISNPFCSLKVGTGFSHDKMLLENIS